MERAPPPGAGVRGGAATVGRAVTTLELQVMLLRRRAFRCAWSPRAESLTTAVQALLLAKRASDWPDSALAL